MGLEGAANDSPALWPAAALISQPVPSRHHRHHEGRKARREVTGLYLTRIDPLQPVRPQPLNSP